MSIKSRSRSVIRDLIPLRLLSKISATSSVILRYHSVAGSKSFESEVIPSSIRHTAELFDEQMALLVRDYEVTDLDSIWQDLNCSQRQNQRVAITFDDGYKDNIVYVAPILAKYGIKATFYVISGAIESGRLPWFCQTFHYFSTTRKRDWLNPVTMTRSPLATNRDRETARREVNGLLAASSHEGQVDLLAAIQNELNVIDPPSSDIMLSADDIRSLGDQGHTIGSHSHSHPNLALLESESARFEILESKNSLEAISGRQIQHFAFPNPFSSPHWNTPLCKLIEQCGYSSAVTSTSGRITKSANQFAFPRMAVPQSVADLKWKLDRAFVGV